MRRCRQRRRRGSPGRKWSPTGRNRGFAARIERHVRPLRREVAEGGRVFGGDGMRILSSPMICTIWSPGHGDAVLAGFAGPERQWRPLQLMRWPSVIKAIETGSIDVDIAMMLGLMP